MPTDQERMRAADLVPVPFDLADQGCPGKKPPDNGTAFGLCHTCERFGRDGDQLEPALKKVAGVCQCVNWERMEPLRLRGDGVHGVPVL